MSSVHGPRRSSRISWITVLLLFIVATALLGSYSVIHRLQLGLEACKGRERAAHEKQHEEQKRLAVAKEMMGGLTTAELAERSKQRYEAMLLPGLESTKWRPMVLRNCTIDMPPYYAPCLSSTTPNIVYAEEVVYPDFEVALPGFTSKADAELWVRENYGYHMLGQTGANRRVLVDTRQGVLAFVGLRGQNVMYKNLRWHEGKIPFSWMGDSTHCLGHMFPHTQFEEEQLATEGEQGEQGEGDGEEEGDDEDGAGRRLLQDAGGVQVVDDVAIYATPDNARYQHFLDHATKPLMQTAHLITNTTLILPGGGLNSKQGIVQTMWGWMTHIDAQRQVQRDDKPVFAKRALVSCRVPYVHPYLFYRFQELTLGPESTRVPLSQRKVVLWYSRSIEDSERSNAGRRILNEDAVKAAIVKLLQERGLGERLEVHHPGKFKDPLEYARWINQNVAALLGPHGGGLCNIKWLARETLVLEFMPRSWINEALYAESYGHGVNYWVELLNPEGHAMDMTANVDNVINILRAELGKPAARGPLLRRRYDWPNAMVAISDDPDRVDLSGQCCNAPNDNDAGLYVLPQPPATEVEQQEEAQVQAQAQGLAGELGTQQQDQQQQQLQQ